MIAHLTSGRSVSATDYSTATVTLATKSGRGEQVTWSEVDHIVSEDGLQRHRDVVDGQPTIIVQSVKDPCWVAYQPPLVQSDLFAPPAPPKLPLDDTEDAIALIDLVETQGEGEAVLAALKASFEGESRKRLWGQLSPEQRAKLNNVKKR